MTDYNWSAEEILNARMREHGNDAYAETIRDYLKRLLVLVWEEGDCFDGKRPFGNSGWDHDIYSTLIDELGYDEDDFTGMNEAISVAINAL